MITTVIEILTITTNVIRDNVAPINNGVESRMWNHNDVNITDAPYQVSLMFNNAHFCTGNIIGKRAVLTDNHQLLYFYDASDFSINYGSSKADAKSNIIPVQQIVPYTSTYKPYEYEVSVLLLEYDITYSAVAKPIPVAWDAPTVGTYANITGWRLVDETPSYLHQHTVQIADRSVCQDHFPTRIAQLPDLLCAVIKRNESDACEYDSGSSLVSNGKLIGTFVIGAGCGPENFYGLFTNVANYKKWILGYLDDDQKN